VTLTVNCWFGVTIWSATTTIGDSPAALPNPMEIAQISADKMNIPKARLGKLVLFFMIN
jgi:hypothetical protein